MVPTMNAVALDTGDKTSKGFGSEGFVTGQDNRDLTPPPEELLRLAQNAESQSATYMQANNRTSWARSYKAYRNAHAEGSKYLSPEFRGRSKFFRPKTRSAVKRSMAQITEALLGPGDVVSVDAMDQGDPYQQASASLKRELINYRLSRTSRRNGIRWFLIVAGAMQTGKITGLIVSKQTWRYREDKTQPPRLGGRPAVIEDRPDIELIPPENCLFDQNCDWTNPAQSSQYLILRYPHSVDTALEIIRANLGCGYIKFYPITREELQGHVSQGAPVDTVGTRTARNAGKDPTSQASGQFGRLWLNEVFMRVGDVDYVYWTINNTKMISAPVPVSKAYPHLAGDRPVVIGYGEVEAFRPTPMSSVEALQGLQMEINDQANLRLDHMKQVVSPPAKVKRGKRVDMTQLQRKGPNGAIMVNDQDDIEWFQQPDVPQSAYLENNLVSADFDSLAGVFDAGSISNNRQMNETVGGMKLLANSTNPLSNFDMNVFVETWAEPVLVQVMKLEEYYESDETILAIAGEKAQLFDRFRIDAITDQLLLKETTLTIAIGAGASNVPEEKLKNFANAWTVAQGMLGPMVQAGVIAPPVPKVKSIIDFVFSGANIKDAATRFFGMIDDSGQPQPPGPNPEADAKMAQVNAQREKTQVDANVKMATLQSKEREAYAKLKSDHMKALAEIGRAMIEARHGASAQARDHLHDHLMRQMDHAHGSERDEASHGRQMQMKEADNARENGAERGVEGPPAQMPDMNEQRAAERHQAYMDAIRRIANT